jgi:hypothetical protein
MQRRAHERLPAPAFTILCMHHTTLSSRIRQVGRAGQSRSSVAPARWAEYGL